MKRMLTVALLLSLVASATVPKPFGLALLGEPAVAQGAETAAATAKPFGIQVVDAATGRGVPLVELRTVHNLRYVTDSGGWVAIDDPELMGEKVFFSVRSHGYEFAKDGFGFAGTALAVEPGGSATLKIARRNLAERLYRITGGGIYADSVRLGRAAPVARPLLSGRVFGQDSVQAAVLGERLYWFWGDTNLLRYPLGLFKTSGATSALPGRGLDPDRGVDLDYFTNDRGESRAMCPLEGEGVVWLDGLMAVRDAQGRAVLVAHYARMKSLDKMLEHGLAVFDPADKVFRKHCGFALDEPWRFPAGQAERLRDGEQTFCLFARPYATVRVRAELSAAADPTQYEAFTCLKPGTRYDKQRPPIERDGDGKPVWGWKRDADPLDADRERELIAAGHLPADDARYQPRDDDSGKPVKMHGGSIRWNEFRRKWLLLAVEIGGASSFLGEVWYAEADAPTGPWRQAKKIVTHDRYSFYNPTHHAFLDQQGGRLIYFEGTYTQTFSGNPDATPRYDYNQIMYRLDLSQIK
jgi:hypothetical protein